MIDHRRKSLSDLWDVLGCQTRCCGCIASREAWATYVPTDYFGIPHNTPSLALKFCRSYCFQMQSGIWNNSFCFLAGNFFPTVCTLLGYFKVTRQLTMKLFPAKIFEWATLQNLWRQRVRCFVTRECLPTTAITARFHEFPATSGFIQKIPTIFQRLFKDHIRFSRTTY